MEIEYEEEYDGAEGFEKEKKHKTVKGCLTFLVAAAILLLLLGFLLYKTTLPENWSHFNRKRISFIEDKYKISLYNAEPISYKEHALAQDMESRFIFEVSDYKEFMENDFHGKAIIKGYDEADADYATYTCRIDENKCFLVRFTKNGDKYEGILTCYRDRES